MQAPPLPPQTFVLGYQEGTIEPKTIGKLHACTKVEELAPLLRATGLVAQSLGNGVIFIFPSLEKLEFYIRMKKELMGVFLQEEAGATLKPLERSTPAGSIPQYWFDQLSSSVMTSSNTRLTKANPVLLQLSCELVLATDDKEVSVRLNLARIPSTTLLGKLKGSAAVEGGVLPSEKAFPVSLEEAVRNYPYVSFTLSGLTIKAWGKPIQNSAAAKIYEEYFKGLKERTEDAEKRLGQIHRDFMAELGQSNPLWKELSACKDTKFSGASKELVLAVDTGLRSGSDPFSSPQDKADFIANSKIKRVRPFLGILAPTMNHKGSFSLGGFDF